MSLLLAAGFLCGGEGGAKWDGNLVHILEETCVFIEDFLFKGCQGLARPSTAEEAGRRGGHGG